MVQEVLTNGVNEMNDLTTTGHAVAVALAYYMYNVSRINQMRKLFPDADDSYISQKAEQAHAGLPTLFGALDEAHQRQYVSDALDAYGEAGFKAANRAALEQVAE